MQTNTRWEDDENNRTVHLRIDAQVDSSTPTITPVRVEFTNQERMIGVWTATGRDLLMRQLEASGRMDDVLNHACAAIV